MPVKKLSIKKGKKGKLVVHKEPPAETDDETPTLKLEEDPPPFEPDENEDEKPKKTFGKGKVGKPIQGTVAVKEPDSDEKLEQVYIDGAESVEPAGKPMANVGYGLDRTINLGNFESLKIHVTLHVPSEVDEAEIEGNYNFCKGWVEKKMDQVSAEYVVDTDD